MRILNAEKRFQALGTWIIPALALIFVSSCAPSAVLQKDIGRIIPPQGVSVSSEEAARIGAEAEKRNLAVEDDPDWIEQSYRKIDIKALDYIPEKEYAEYKKYLDNGRAYILVHPSYFPFFHYRPPLSKTNQSLGQAAIEDETGYEGPNDYIYDEKKVDSASEAPKSPGAPEPPDESNAVERFISKRHEDIRISVIQAQERRTRDFIEFMSTNQKLLILVIPGDYRHFKGYAYRKSKDEFARYLNEITNESPSVIYMESRSARRGYLSEEELVRLMEFLTSIGAENIMVGGGYIGRCLEDFYISLFEEYKSEHVFMVPQLSDVSPKDLGANTAAALMNEDGTLNIERATKNLSYDVYRVQEINPNLMNLR